MEQLQFTEGIGAISKFFGMTWPVDALNAAYEQVKTESIQSLVSAHKRIVLEFSPRPQPPIGKITAIIQQEARKIRLDHGDQIESDWNEQKALDARHAKQFFKKGVQRDKHAASSMKLINHFLDQTLDKQQVIEGMKWMEQQYSGIGWDEEAKRLVRHFHIEAIGEQTE